MGVEGRRRIKGKELEKRKDDGGMILVEPAADTQGKQLTET